MRKRLLLATGGCLLLFGWFSAFLLSSFPQQTTMYILAPTLLLGVGLGLMHKTAGWKIAAVTLTFTALTALLAMNQFFPSRSVSISAFKERMRNSSQTGTMVPILVAPGSRTEVFTDERFLETFANIEVKLFASLPGAGQMMCRDTSGNLYVTIPELGAIYLFKDVDQDGFAEDSILYHVGLDRPSGLLWSNDKIYVAEPSQLLELQDTDQDHQADTVRVVIDGLPDDGGHWKRSLASDKDESLYLSVGSRCNACEEENQLRGTVLKIDLDNGEYSIFAKGLRHVPGLVYSTEHNTLWGTEIGREDLGDQVSTDEVNQIVNRGHYGWPFCYGNNSPDPSFGSSQSCEETLSAAVSLSPHSNPFGIALGGLLNAPDAYKNSFYLVLRGPTEISQDSHMKLIRIPYKDGKIADYGKEFLRGWSDSESLWGSPAAVLSGADGHLYLSDDRAQAIYRIRWLSTQ